MQTEYVSSQWDAERLEGAVKAGTILNGRMLSSDWHVEIDPGPLTFKKVQHEDVITWTVTNEFGIRTR